MKKLVDSKELCSKLGISIATLRRLCANGQIPYIKLLNRRVMFDPDQIDQWLKDRTVRVNQWV